MKKRILVFFLILGMMVAIPIILFPLNASVEDAQLNLAVELYRKGQYADSITELHRLQTDMGTKKYLDACYFYRGHAHLAMKQYDKANTQFKYIVDSVPDSDYYDRSLYQFGRTEYLRGNFQTAIGVFDEYMQRYPTLDYADNSLYWKGESLLSLGEREQARSTFEDVLHIYPTGNKADAAYFKLRLMDMEDDLAARGQVVPQEQEMVVPIPEGATPEEIAEWEAREKQHQQEVSRLEEQLERLRAEIDSLREMGELSDIEAAARIEERMKALLAWENILKIKEETLAQKELQLDLQFEKIEQISTELERIENE
jgi:TolA-binding protein